MKKTVRMGNMEIVLNHGEYAHISGERIIIETDKVTVAIRDDGTIHVLKAKHTTAYNSDDETVEVRSI